MDDAMHAPAESFLARCHARAMETGYRVPPWDRFDPRRMEDGDRESARRAWSAQAAAEYRSLVVFGELIARFPEAGLPLAATGAAARLLADEARHTEWCARLADLLGGCEPWTLRPEETRLPDALPVHLFVARWVVSMFNVGECGSVPLLRARARGATEPCTRALLATLLRDEAMHDRMGWAFARLVIPRLTRDERHWLGSELTPVLGHYRDQHEAQGGGEAFTALVQSVIVPRLEVLGVPAGAAWLAVSTVRVG